LEAELQQELMADTELIPSSGGVYEVEVDGEKIFSKKELRRFPREGEILQLVREKIKTSGKLI
jgi:selenoprotein W-related protein